MVRNPSINSRSWDKFSWILPFRSYCDDVRRRNMGCSWVYVARKLNYPYKSDNYPGFNRWNVRKIWVF